MQTINKGHHPQIPTTTADAMVEGPLKFREPKILNFTNSYNIFQAHSYSPRGRIKVMREIALNKLLFLFRLRYNVRKFDKFTNFMDNLAILIILGIF